MEEACTREGLHLRSLIPWTMQMLPPRTLFVLLAHAHVFLSLRNNGEVRAKEEHSASSAYSARTFHGSPRESHQHKARDRALSSGYATGASSAELQAQWAIIRGPLNSTHPWKRVIAGKTRRIGHNKRDFRRTGTPVEDRSREKEEKRGGGGEGSAAYPCTQSAAHPVSSCG